MITLRPSRSFIFLSLVFFAGSDSLQGQVIEVSDDTTLDARNTLPTNSILVLDGPGGATRVELIAGGQLSTEIFGESRVTGESTLVINGGAFGAEMTVEQSAHLGIHAGRFTVADSLLPNVITARPTAVRLKDEATFEMTGGEIDYVANTVLAGVAIHAEGETRAQISGGKVQAFFEAAVRLNERAHLTVTGGELRSIDDATIAAADDASIRVSGGTIYGGETGAAIMLSDRAEAVFTGGQIQDLESSNAIYADARASLWLENVELRSKFGTGVRATDMTSLTLVVSQIRSENTGLFADGDSRVIAVDTTIGADDGAALAAGDASQIKLTGVSLDCSDHTALGVTDHAKVDLWQTSVCSEEHGAIRVLGNGTANIRSAALRSHEEDEVLVVADEGTVRIFGFELADDGNRVKGVFRDGSEFDWLYNVTSPDARIELIDLARVDFNDDAGITPQDIDVLGEAIRMGSEDATFDLDGSGNVDRQDLEWMVSDDLGTAAGDSNLDVRFDSGDLVRVFQVGLYETGEQAGWASGDWNQDGVFDSQDLVHALQSNQYLETRAAPAAVVPEPSSLLLVGFALLMGWFSQHRRRRHQL